MNLFPNLPPRAAVLNRLRTCTQLSCSRNDYVHQTLCFCSNTLKRFELEILAQSFLACSEELEPVPSAASTALELLSSPEAKKHCKGDG